MLVFNAPRDLTATLYKLRARTMHENVHAWSRIRSQRYIIIYQVILCIYSWTLNRSIHCSRIKHDMLQCTTWMFWYIQFITNKHFTTQLSSIVFRTKHCCDHNVTLVHYFVICTRTLHVDLCIIETWAKPDNTASYYYNGLLLRLLGKCVCHQNTLYHSVTKFSYSSIWCKKIKCNIL